jgi:integrase
LGLRQGEILGLRWSDVDVETSTLRVAQALQRVNGRLEFVEPKSRRSRRTIPMPPTVARALRAHRSRQLEERIAVGPRWRESDLVFTTSIGTPLDSRNVTRRFQAALERASLPRLRFHDLRHTAASLMLAQGVPARVVMETLGHSQISLTMNTYSHVVPALQREAADRMDVVRVDRPPSLQEGGRIEAGWSPGGPAALAGRRGGYRPGWCCSQGSPRWTIGSSAIFYHPAGFA